VLLHYILIYLSKIVSKLTIIFWEQVKRIFLHRKVQLVLFVKYLQFFLKFLELFFFWSSTAPTISVNYSALDAPVIAVETSLFNKTQAIAS